MATPTLTQLKRAIAEFNTHIGAAEDLAGEILDAMTALGMDDERLATAGELLVKIEELNGETFEPDEYEEWGE